jgi:hypothetical protein
LATPEEVQATMIANLPEKTGRSLEAWIAEVRGSGLEKHGQILSMLKEHGVSHGYANLIAHMARERAAGRASSGADAAGAGEPDLVAAQYASKEDLRPIYDRIASAVRGFGDDVELAPKKAYVSLRRSMQFGLLQPSTKTRLDVGIKLKDAGPTVRLEAAGSWNAMVTHRVRVTSRDEVDDELIGWLRRAYEEAG